MKGLVLVGCVLLVAIGITRKSAFWCVAFIVSGFAIAGAAGEYLP